MLHRSLACAWASQPKGSRTAAPPCWSSWTPERSWCAWTTERRRSWIQGHEPWWRPLRYREAQAFGFWADCHLPGTQILLLEEGETLVHAEVLQAFERPRGLHAKQIGQVGKHDEIRLQFTLSHLPLLTFWRDL